MAQISAPNTPPRLYAVNPEPAMAGDRPSEANIVGSQLKALYTASRHMKNAAQIATVSRARPVSNNELNPACCSAFCSAASTNVVDAVVGRAMRDRSLLNSGQRFGLRARKRGDSGRTKNISTLYAIGTRPPIQNRPRQP